GAGADRAARVRRAAGRQAPPASRSGRRSGAAATGLIRSSITTILTRGKTDRCAIRFAFVRTGSALTLAPQHAKDGLKTKDRPKIAASITAGGRTSPLGSSHQ